MALIKPTVRKMVEAKIVAAYQREFGELQGSNPDAPASWQKQAKIAADIAEAIIDVLLSQAEIAPGIPVNTSGGPGATSGPGKIM
jgi:hypothetical protein